jgi:hypothetical protein
MLRRTQLLAPCGQHKQLGTSTHLPLPAFRSRTALHLVCSARVERSWAAREHLEARDASTSLPPTVSVTAAASAAFALSNMVSRAEPAKGQVGSWWATATTLQRGLCKLVQQLPRNSVPAGPTALHQHASLLLNMHGYYVHANACGAINNNCFVLTTWCTGQGGYVPGHPANGGAVWMVSRGC